MKKPKNTTFSYVLPHLGSGLADAIKAQVVDDFVVPELEKAPPVKKLELVVKITR